MSLYHFRKYASETDNAEEISLATKELNVVWKQEYKNGAPWIRASPKVELTGSALLRSPG